MELILKNVQKEHLPLINELAKMLKVEVHLNETNKYDKKFVAEILSADQDLKDGKGVRIKIEDLWK